jgi:glycosyltransferase involved in cell wall biosynthesis
MMAATSDHIVFICSGLNTPGGIEKAIVTTANLFRSKGHRVTLVVLADTSESFYPIDPSIVTCFARLHFGITESGNFVTRKLLFIHHIIRLRSILKLLRPGLVIATEYHLTIAASLAWKCKSVISWEHHHYGHLAKNGFWHALYLILYPRIRSVIALNPSEAAFYSEMGCTTLTIPNFVEQPSSPPKAEEHKVLLTIGWLTTLKGMDLIPAIARIVFEKHPGWEWKVIGTGPLKASLAKELAFLGLTRQVEVIQPLSPDLTMQYTNASVYVMLSKFECFPMVLLEAMSHGLPPVAFDCPTGPGYIISDGTDGVLVPAGDVLAMAAAIVKLIEDDEGRRLLGATAACNVRRYAPEKTYALWEEVLNNRN